MVAANDFVAAGVIMRRVVHRHSPAPPQPQPANATQSAHKNLSAISNTSKLPQLTQAGGVGSLIG
jgi:hypothetical protein